MRKLDDILYDKLECIVFYILVKHIKADLEVNNITEITEEMILTIKEQCQIEGMIIDVDDTLRKDLKPIPNCNKEWLEMVAKHLKIVVLSNSIDKDLKPFFEELGIRYIPLAFKPSIFGFRKACKEMKLKPKNVVMVGDSLWDDIMGAKKNRMKTIEVNDVEER